MHKSFNWICLMIWSFQFAMGMYWMGSGKPISPVLYLLAVAGCILHFIGELLE